MSYLAAAADTAAQAVARAVKLTCGPRAQLGDRISQGRNSRVYSVTVGGRTEFAAKLYAKPSSGQADRLLAEFNALQFLWRNGVRDVPEPVASDSSVPIGIYRWVEGSRIPSEAVGWPEVDAACRFLAQLTSIRSAPGAEGLLPAAEACFSLNAVIESVRGRLARFSGMKAGSAVYRECLLFLKDNIAPALETAAPWAFEMAEAAGLDTQAPLPLEQRTLSPSDFGFHNALRRPNGAIVFLDFEYFGWDDPAKLVADTLLHPAMDLPHNLKARFHAGLLRSLPSPDRLKAVVPIVYPLFGIKWSLILLNEFLKEGLVRREYAGGGEVEAGLLPAQLHKSKSMLTTAMAAHDRFPYN